MKIQSPTTLSEVATIKQKTVSGTVSYFLRTGLLQAVGLVSTLVLSAYLTPEDFGVFGVVTVIIGILVFFSDIGLAAALVQKKELPTVVEYRTTFTVQQLLAWFIVVIVLSMISSGWIAHLAGPEAGWILLTLGLSFPLASLKTIPSIILERELLFSKLVIPQVVEQITFHGILIYCALSGFGVIMYAYAVFARAVIGVIVMLAIQRWPFGFALDTTALKTLLRFGVQFQLNDLLARVKDQLYYLFLAGTLPLAQFGYIQWAKNWSLYPYTLTVQNIMAITFPTFSRLQHDKALLTRALEKTLFFISLILFPIIVGMSIFITPLIELFPVYEKWLPAVLTLVFFNAATAWSGISTPLTNTLNAVGKISTTLKLMIMWTTLTWVLTPPAITYFGFNGVALAAFVVSCTSYVTIHLVKKFLPISVWPQVWRQLLASGVMAAVGYFGRETWSENLQNLAFGIVLAGISYIVVVLLFGKEKLLAEVSSLRSKAK